MTEDQKQRLLEIQNKIYKDIKPFIELMNRIWESIKDLVIDAYKSLKEFLQKKVPIRTKSYKKGKRYIHSYKKKELWKVLKLDDKNRKALYNKK